MTTKKATSRTSGTRRNVVWGMSSLSALVLLFGYHTSTNQAGASAVTTATPSVPAGSTGAGSSSSGGTASSSSSSSSGATSTTVTGDAAQTRWGPVQVQLTVSGGKVTAVDVLQQPDENHEDQEINARALPILVQETLSAQSAQIDAVSGATYTSDGYTTSLQSALDQAGLA